MSSTVWFSIVNLPPRDNHSEIFDWDKDGFDGCVCYNAKTAPEWVKQYGLLKKVHYLAVDHWKCCKELYGVTGDTLIFYQDDSVGCYSNGGNLIGVLTEEDLKPYYYDDYRDEYVVCLETIGESFNKYILGDIEIREGIYSAKELIYLAKQLIEKSGIDDYSFNSEALFPIMRAYFAADAGKVVLCDID